jgi:hypothetical protein
MGEHQQYTTVLAPGDSDRPREKKLATISTCQRIAPKGENVGATATRINRERGGIQRPAFIQHRAPTDSQQGAPTDDEHQRRTVAAIGPGTRIE